MININELRIGNWALYPHTIHEPFQITEPRHIELAYLLKPIPLTPEILEACGFEQLQARSWNLSWESYELHYSEHDKELGILSPDGCTTGHTVFFPCGQLHLLQNIFFFFTGSELSVNLDKVKA